jgi:ribosomal protein S18 acetylase RimI-like enzyme
MRSGVYASYLEAAIQGYARENVAAGRWPEVGALERSRDDFHALLPAGIDTPDNYLFEILEGEDDPVIGFIWYALGRKRGSCLAFIYDLEILEAHRRKGHARRALLALEQHAAERGATAVGLNVFAANHVAQELYRKLGYAVTNFNMSKPLTSRSAVHVSEGSVPAG